MKSKFSIRLVAVSIFALTAAIRVHAQDAQNHYKHHHYKLIVVGTLGGPQSYGDPGNGAANINNEGTAVGVADTSIADPFYPNFNPLLSGVTGSYPFIYHPFTTKGGAIVDLGGLPGGYNSVASFITKSGLLAGEALNGSMDPFTGWPAEDPVVWENGEIANLGSLGGYEGQSGQANSKGQVTGFTTNAIPDPFSIIYSVFTGGQFPNGTQTRAFLWDESQGMQDIGTLGGPDAFAPYLNEHGQIAGFSYTNSTPNSSTGVPTLDPFLWENGTMIDLGTLGGTNGGPGGLNNRGEVIGTSNLAGDLAGHPFLWTPAGPMRDLGTLGGPCGSANAINEQSAVVGVADIAGVPCGEQSHAFLWTPKSGMSDLGTVGADCFSAAFDINNQNQAVGLSISCDGNAAEAVLWENGRIINLNVFVPPGFGIDLEDVETINDRGELFGEAFLDNGESRAFLLIPCDDNHLNVEGCDYSMMEESPAVSVQQTVHGRSGRTLLQQIHHPRLKPWGMRGIFARPTGHAPTATLRDEGQMVSTPLADDLGPVEKLGIAHEIPGEAGRSAQREADGEISSCSRGERGASSSEVPALGYVVHGGCSVNENASTLTGYCQGPILFSHSCSGAKDVSQCPSGQKAKEPGWITCGNFAVIRVDDKRSCEFVFK